MLLRTGMPGSGWPAPLRRVGAGVVGIDRVEQCGDQGGERHQRWVGAGELPVARQRGFDRRGQHHQCIGGQGSEGQFSSRARPPAPPDGGPANAIGRPANADSRLGKPVGSLASAAGSPADAVGRLGNPVCRLGNAVSGLGNAVSRLGNVVCKSAKPLKKAHFPQNRPFWPFLALPRPPKPENRRKPLPPGPAEAAENSG